mgnify:CR=1 FL=1
MAKDIKGIEDLQPDAENANKGTERGRGMVEHSLRQYGAGRSIVVDRDGGTIAGNKTLEAAADIGLPVRVVQTDGSELVVVQRTDLDLDGDGPEAEMARQLAYADNRTSEVGLDWDLERMAADLEGGLDLSSMFSDGELDKILGELRGKSLKGNPRYMSDLRDVAELVDPEAQERFAWVETAVIDFSGGRDSSLAALWARANLPQARVLALYVDLGAEFPGFPVHVIRVAQHIGMELEILRTPQTIFEGLLEEGWPPWIAPWCQNWMHNALAERIRAEFNSRTTVRLTGARSKQRKTISLSMADAPLGSSPEYQAFAPIFDWTEESVMQMLATHEVPLWDGYTRGFNRTCCWCCPGQRPAVYAAMRRQHPELFSAYLYLEKLLGYRHWDPKYRDMGLVALADKGEQLLARRQAGA